MNLDVRILRSQRGTSTIITSVVGLVILAVVILSYLQLSRVSRSVASIGESELEAQFYATELLEFMLSMPEQQFAAYVRDIPYQTTLATKYFLCAHINIRDKATGNRLNPDDSAELPPEAFKGRWARRYYKVDVVNRSDLTPKNSVCSQPVDAYSLATSGEEAYWVTVFVDFTDDRGAVQSIMMGGEIYE